MKITFADVMTRVPLRLSRLVSPTLHYVSISLRFISLFNAFFLLFEHPSSKIKCSIVQIHSKITVSLPFVQKM